MKKTLANYFLLISFLCFSIFFLVIGILFYGTSENLTKISTKDIRSKLIANYKMQLRNRVEIISQQIETKTQQAQKRLKEDSLKRVNEAHKIAYNIYNSFKDTKSEEEIAHLIKETLRQIKFHNGRGYFFIDDTDGNCILYPIRPNLEGKNIINIQDINGKYVVKDFINIAQTTKAGFSSYYTYKDKYEKDAKRYEKIAYVKYFEPFDWIIGTGEYIVDVRKDIQKEIAYEVGQMRLDNHESYVNIFEVNNFSGGEDFARVIVSPNSQGEIYGAKISSLVQDDLGRYYRQEFLEKINRYGEGFYTYNFKKLNSQRSVEKLSFAKLIPELNWVIATGIYLDDLENTVNRNKEIIQKEQESNILTTWFVIFFVFLVFLVLFYFLSRKIKFETNRIASFFKRAAKRKEKINIHDFFIEDFKYLGNFANLMLDKIYEQQDRLLESNTYLESRVLEKTQELSQLNKFLEEKNKLLEEKHYTDTLTSLDNRNMFLKDLDALKSGSVILIDIDSFKNINDFYGTSTGDKVLKTLAVELQNLAFENTMNVYRLGSDEFIFMSEGVMETDELKIKVKLFLAELKEVLFYDSSAAVQIHVDFTCGIASGKEGLLGKADSALNFAKRNKRNYAFYDSENADMNVYKRNIYWRNKIQWAIKEDNIVPYFQPIVDTKNKEFKKYESLMRMIDNDEPVSPYAFLEIAKETKLYTALSKIMIEKTFLRFEHENVDFSLNIALEDIENSSMVAFIIKKIEQYNIGKRLVLEVLESDYITASKAFLPFVEKMRSHGVRFALDDFGSGYSNFAFLLKMQPKFLKIDGSLVVNLEKDTIQYKIVQTIVTFAKQIDATVIAEFVETKESVKLCNELGITHLQGYFFGKPQEDLQ